ncbi:MAG: type 2 isopentenyl-diphosphate Delta-isomerase [Bdellovibrio sp.]|nr:MAG: type 2 isopentenyl-diphosphate Delta-isomerase [Bdellovibrio sp.]
MSPSLSFERRKKDHIDLALKQENEALGQSGFHSIHLLHEALPEIDFDDVSLGVLSFQRFPSPFFVSSMTAGHKGGVAINEVLAMACEKKGWLMGVGSQRKQLSVPEAAKEWKSLRKKSPHVSLMGNIGLSQLIQTSTKEIQRLVDSLEAVAMVVHTNPLQECLQPEGTPHFKGGLKAIESLCKELSVPVILKETGCGFSRKTLERLNGLGLYAVDVSGYGGTHWGRIEGQRAPLGSLKEQAALSFAQWGESTVQSLLEANSLTLDYAIWASGGIRTGVDGAKALALGAEMVGLAKPMLQAALEGPEALLKKMELLEYELKTALFCTGCESVQKLREKQPWVQKQKI